MNGRHFVTAEISKTYWFMAFDVPGLLYPIHILEIDEKYSIITTNICCKHMFIDTFAQNAFYTYKEGVQEACNRITETPKHFSHLNWFVAIYHPELLI